MVSRIGPAWSWELGWTREGINTRRWPATFWETFFRAIKPAKEKIQRRHEKLEEKQEREAIKRYREKVSWKKQPEITEICRR